MVEMVVVQALHHLVFLLLLVQVANLYGILDQKLAVEMLV
jgi:hypothetical protein